jgi:[CysO sulfur-carrier protein]-S-L-cysteine hydrolase
MRISLTEGQVDRLVSIAEDALPNESCAFLLGNNESVTEILPMQNADKSRFSFSIGPPEVLRAYDLAESKGLQVIGIFHSHPSNPAPSNIDRKFMEINPVVWLIYSSTEQKFGAYVYDIDVREVAVRITA